MMTKDDSNAPKSPRINHGGAVDLAGQKYGIPAEQWLDLSTGINPVAYSVPELDPALWRRLPLASELDQLKDAAKAYYSVPDTGHLVCAPGTQALIQTIPFWIKDQVGKSQVHIFGPTYGEHAQCWTRAGHDCHLHQTSPDQRLDHIRETLATLPKGSVAVLVNPNNPDGALFEPAMITELANIAQARQCWLVVDEAFMDHHPNQSVCSIINQLPSTIVLRSFGKFFGLAGARLGFAVMAPSLATDLENRIGPWAVPGPTIAVGISALTDHAWQDATRQRLAKDSQRLDRLVTRYSKLVNAGATDLFRYYHSHTCQALADHLAKAGILVRCFDHDPQKIRFGLPGTETDWQRLEAALTTWSAGQMPPTN
jgi:cobalamin biosynthetic protein CobC